MNAVKRRDKNAKAKARRAARLTHGLLKGFCPAHDLAGLFVQCVRLCPTEIGTEVILEICPWHHLNGTDFKPFLRWWTPACVEQEQSLAYCDELLNRLVPIRDELFYPDRPTSFRINLSTGELV